MRARHRRIPLHAALLAAALAACGDGAAAGAEQPSGSSAPVYTSEVERVSEWIGAGGEAGDTAGLVATRNPRGEGVLVYSRDTDSAAGGERAAWVVVDSQVVPLNRASRRSRPDLPAPEEDEATWQRIGIPRSGGEADLRGVVPADPPAPQRQSPPAAAPPEPAPAPARAAEPRDTVRIPVDPTPRPRVPLPVPREAPPAEADPPRDTLHLPSPAEPATDTLHIPRAPADPTPVGLPPAD